MATDKGKETRKMMLYVGGAAAVVALLGGYWLFGSSDEPARPRGWKGKLAGKKLMIPNTTSC
jgi:hypothetical protein